MEENNHFLSYAVAEIDKGEIDVLLSSTLLLPRDSKSQGLWGAERHE